MLGAGTLELMLAETPGLATGAITAAIACVAALIAGLVTARMLPRVA
jgi:hypothetical protein